MLRGESRPKIGIALGGGTARGSAHIGVLKVLEAHDLRPTVVSGTSYGAAMAALYALGYPALEIERIIRHQNNFELWGQALDFGLHNAAMVNGKRLERFLDRKYFHSASFDDLQMPLKIITTDVDTGEMVVIQEGSLARAVRASSAIPVLTSAVPYKHHMVIDGGFADTVPFQSLLNEDLDLIIGVHTGIETEDTGFVRRVRRFAHSELFSRWWHSIFAGERRGHVGAQRRGLLRMLASYEQRVVAPEGALLVRVNPPIAWWDFHRSPEAIDLGEQVMLEHLADVKMMLEKPDKRKIGAA